jgi:flagellar protein FliS
VNHANPWKSYRQISTQTASPGQLVLMLYDGAIRFLERALLGFDKEDPADFAETISNNVLRAQDIIQELNYSLDLQRGGSFASNLRDLYSYMDRRLMQSNLEKTPDGIRDVIARLSILREAWASMLGNGANSAADSCAEGELAVA